MAKVKNQDTQAAGTEGDGVSHKIVTPSENFCDGSEAKLLIYK